MPTSGYVPGAAQPAPMLTDFAIQASTPPENFVGNLILPDAETASFMGKAPVRGNEELEVDDDDLIGNKTDFPEVMFSEGETSWELGMHGRKAIVGAVSIEKARQTARFNGAGGDPLYNLETRVTGLLTAQNMRRNELLRIRRILNTALYPADNVFDSIEIDTATDLRETLITASEVVEAAGQGPANLVVFGRGALRGADRNPSLLDLMPEDSPRVLTRGAISTLMRLPEDTSRVEFATAVYRTRPGETPKAMFDNWIWVGRVKAAPDGKAAFGWNYWMPCMENGQRIYMNRILVGNQENRHIGLKNFYLPSDEDFSLGVLIPTTISEPEEE
jgi:hypothetical protein